MARRPVYSEIRALVGVENWLLADANAHNLLEDNQLDKSEAPARVGAIMAKKLPEEWKRFQFLRRYVVGDEKPTDDLVLSTAKTILDATATARRAYVEERIIGGDSAETAEMVSREVLRKYTGRLMVGEAVRPDVALLERPFHIAINTYAGNIRAHEMPLPSYIGLVGLTLTHIAEQPNHVIQIPKPGMPDGSLVQWYIPGRLPYEA